MGAGLILEATRVSPVDALVAMNGFYDAERTQEQVRGRCNWIDFRKWLSRERCRLTRSSENADFDPFQIYPLDGVTRQYVDNVLRKNPNFGTRVGMGFATSLLLFAPEQRLSHLTSVPMLIIHGERNELHPPAEAQSLHERYPGPRTLHWIRGAGHTEWMLDDHPSFQSLVGYIDRWIQRLG
jgi:pimeloyl-ACP methyl ester carboxylesterase